MIHNTIHPLENFAMQFWFSDKCLPNKHFKMEHRKTCHVLRLQNMIMAALKEIDGWAWNSWDCSLSCTSGFSSWSKLEVLLLITFNIYLKKFCKLSHAFIKDFFFFQQLHKSLTWIPKWKKSKYLANIDIKVCFLLY